MPSTSKKADFICYFTRKEIKPELVLCNPIRIHTYSLNNILINLVHKYVDSVDTETQMLYLHYLLGKDFKKSSCMLNISEIEAIRCFRTFTSKFNRFVSSQLKHGSIDTKQTLNYIRQLKNKKMDDRQIAAYFHEEITTTKVMRHFLRHASIIS